MKETSSKICMNCGASMTKSSRFCSICGETTFPVDEDFKENPEGFKYLIKTQAKPSEKIVWMNKNFFIKQHLKEGEEILFSNASSRDLWNELLHKIEFSFVLLIISVFVFILSILSRESLLGSIFFIIAALILSGVIIKNVLWYKRLRRKLGLNWRKMREHYEFSAITSERVILKSIDNYKRDFHTLPGVKGDKDLMSIDIKYLWVQYDPPDFQQDVRIKIYYRSSEKIDYSNYFGFIYENSEYFKKRVSYIEKNMNIKHVCFKDNSGILIFNGKIDKVNNYSY